MADTYATISLIANTPPFQERVYACAAQQGSSDPVGLGQPLHSGRRARLGGCRGLLAGCEPGRWRRLGAGPSGDHRRDDPRPGAADAEPAGRAPSIVKE